MLMLPETNQTRVDTARGTITHGILVDTARGTITHGILVDTA